MAVLGLEPKSHCSHCKLAPYCTTPPYFFPAWRGYVPAMSITLGSTMYLNVPRLPDPCRLYRDPALLLLLYAHVPVVSCLHSRIVRRVRDYLAYPILRMQNLHPHRLIEEHDPLHPTFPIRSTTMSRAALLHFTPSSCAAFFVAQSLFSALTMTVRSPRTTCHR